PSYAAFIMRAADSSVAGVPLGPASAIDSLIRGWRASVIGSAQRSQEAASRRWGAALRARIWDPLAQWVRGAPEVFVVPDGALNLVNLAAFPDSSGYWIERGPLLHHLVAERELVELASDTRPRNAGLLAFGGIDYAAAAGGGHESADAPAQA